MLNLVHVEMGLANYSFPWWQLRLVVSFGTLYSLYIGRYSRSFSLLWYPWWNRYMAMLFMKRSSLWKWGIYDYPLRRQVWNGILFWVSSGHFILSIRHPIGCPYCSRSDWLSVIRKTRYCCWGKGRFHYGLTSDFRLVFMMTAGYTSMTLMPGGMLVFAQFIAIVWWSTSILQFINSPQSDSITTIHGHHHWEYLRQTLLSVTHASESRNIAAQGRCSCVCCPAWGQPLIGEDPGPHHIKCVCLEAFHRRWELIGNICQMAQ